MGKLKKKQEIRSVCSCSLQFLIFLWLLPWDRALLRLLCFPLIRTHLKVLMQICI